MNNKISLEDVNQYFIDQGIHTYSEILQGWEDAMDELDKLEEKQNKIAAEAWWRGVSDQWKHAGSASRLLEFKNPYGWSNREAYK